MNLHKRVDRVERLAKKAGVQVYYPINVTYPPIPSDDGISVIMGDDEEYILPSLRQTEDFLRRHIRQTRRFISKDYC